MKKGKFKGRIRWPIAPIDRSDSLLGGVRGPLPLMTCYVSLSIGFSYSLLEKEVPEGRK